MVVVCKKKEKKKAASRMGFPKKNARETINFICLANICTGDFETVDHDTRCVRNTVDSGCSHIIFPLMNMSYSHICGTVEGYWFGNPDGFIELYRTRNSSIMLMGLV